MIEIIFYIWIFVYRSIDIYITDIEMDIDGYIWIYL